MELREYLRLIRRNWPIFVGVTLVFLVGAFVATQLQPPQFTSVSKALISTRSAGTLTDLNLGSTFAQQAARTYADIARTPYVLDPVIADLRLKESAADLAEAVEVTVPENESVLEITVTARTPRLAAAIANGVTDQLGRAVVRLTPVASSKTLGIIVTQVQPAVPDPDSRSPRLWVYLAVAAAVGLVVAFLIALVRRALDTKVRSVQDAQAAARRPPLGGVPFDSRARKSPIVLAEGSDGSRGDAYRSLRTNLRFLDADQSYRVLVVTSSVRNEGKTTSCVNLGVAMAQTGRRVLIIDADLRDSRVAEYCLVDGSIGLTDVLVGDAELSRVIQRWGKLPLSVLPAGRRPPSSSELLDSRRFAEVLAEAQSQYDVVLIDSPPVLSAADAAIVSRLASGAILVCAARRVRRFEVAAAVAAFEQANARILGVLVTMLPGRGRDAEDTPYRYGVQVMPARTRPPEPGGTEPAEA